MANPIQAIRNVYDIVKTAKDNGNPLTDDHIQMLLEHSLDDKELIKSIKDLKVVMQQKICL